FAVIYKEEVLLVQKLGLDPTKETTLHPAVVVYAEFLLATGSVRRCGNLLVLAIVLTHAANE
ncbi:hypothetical protein MKW98_019348, partial [Papaver atlanticum]